jgi:hypothetical protein
MSGAVRRGSAGILDSTLIYASSDMGNPAAHSTRNVPTVLAGGVGGKIRMGRRIKYPTDCPMGTMCTNTSPEYKTVANNKLLTSIANAFGVPVENYGWQLFDPLSLGSLAEL